MSEGIPAPSHAAAEPPGGRPFRLFGFRGVALVELALFFTLCFLVDWWAAGLTRFDGVQPHPYWVIVLLLSVQYGTNEGVIAAVAATAALRLWNLPEQAIGQDLYEYLHVVSREPILWLVAAVLFGELRMRQRRERDELHAKLSLANRESDAIARSYRQLKVVKENLEARVAGQLRTVFTLYQAARAIDKLDEGEVMLGVADLVRSVMRPEKFSLFLLNNDVLESVTNDGWDDEDPFARWFDASSTLFETVVGRQRTLCVARPEDERILMGQGVLAGPLVSEDTGEVVGMVKIESLGFADFSANTVENFRILCEWVGTALAKARRYREANEQRVFADDGTLYSSTYIGRQAEFLAHLGRRLGFETTTITIRPSGLSRLLPDQRMEVATAIGKAVRQSLRDTDLACDFGQHGLVFGVVLPGTAMEQARIVAAKLEKAVRGALPQPLADIPISFAAERVGDAP
ncbi:GAF domain-containing protein [Azospirillum sp. RWY-5-1]|uniref:GAF domain-containing protein n=1 Tax=Azospirillum oleiclasticum TaxID=2735135 RepID=A0ABX2T4M9_9PROT|nr:GAF domain-containing protein [Azospirillum oleiclasticum]NYZ10951.1 GAF domain-containing protein [Azospirillum oleiclasticum]NYZ18113.1 GAF domain-containing protein [Azospirillum oleiclasticum]